MRNIFLVSTFIFLSIAIIGAEEYIISVSDFTVESNNPKYEFLGKGLARIVASELRKSSQIRIIEREQIKKIIKEQEFSLSDFADESKQIRIGAMLSANYILLGEIIDMVDVILISVRMVDISTSEVIWEDELTEKLSTYDYIGAYFAKSVLDELEIGVEKTIVQKIEVKDEKKEEAIVKLSEGVDAFDRDDVEKAKAVLEEVKQIEPVSEVSEVAKYFLAKLVTNTAKFKTITEQYYPLQNPALLGIIKQDKFYILSGASQMLNISTYGIEMENYPLEIIEKDMRMVAGYQFPLLENMGLGLNYFYSNCTDEIYDPVNKPTDSSGRDSMGGTLCFGFSPVNVFSLGLGLSVYMQNRYGYSQSEEETGTDEYADPTNIPLAPFGGLLIKNPESSIIFDIFGGYSLEKTLYFDPGTFPNKRSEAEERGASIFIENTFTLAFNQSNTFLVVKQLNDIFLETGYYYGRLLPALEHWIFDWFSIRAGVEGTLMRKGEGSEFGIGGTGGFSFRIPDWGLGIDANVTYRKRPSRFVDEEFIEEIIPFIIIYKDNTLLNR